MWKTGSEGTAFSNLSLDERGVKGGDICDCECALEDERRESLCSRLLDRFGDLCMFKGATKALACLSESSLSSEKSDIAVDGKSKTA